MPKTKKAIKVDILNKFRSGDDSDSFCLPELWLELHYKMGLRFEDKVTYQKAVRELIQTGIVEPHEGLFDSLCLTDKGVALIYS